LLREEFKLWIVAQRNLEPGELCLLVISSQER
jgi:hypothetical protein